VFETNWAERAKGSWDAVAMWNVHLGERLEVVMRIRRSWLRQLRDVEGGHGLLGLAAGASLLKERLGACCEMGSRLDNRWIGDVCYPAYRINLISSRGRNNRRVTVRGKGRRQEDVKPCFSEYPSCHLEQIIECILVLYVFVSFLQSCWMYMLRLTCGFGEHMQLKNDAGSWGA
jgi:hypothetical protein